EDGPQRGHLTLTKKPRLSKRTAGAFCMRERRRGTQTLATPEARAACSTAEATASRTRGSKAAGVRQAAEGSSDTRSARARAAAIFMASLMSLARASRAPRKMPGKASTLLIWLG